MPADSLRIAVAGVMDRAKEGLAELVALRSVADPRQLQPDECEKAARWVLDVFAEVCVGEVRMASTSDGSVAVHGHSPAPDGAATVLLHCHYDVEPAFGESQWISPAWRLAERNGR
jgi:cysteinylglycine-S-conjugate dipeptidase